MITKRHFGKVGLKDVYKVTLSTDTATASIITFGSALQSLTVPSNAGNLDVVLGYETLQEYITNDGYLGAICGRNSNRIKKASFELLGKRYNLNANDGANNLHGGNVGFSHKVWNIDDICENDCSVTLSLFSPDGEEGFPANLNVKVKYTLQGSALTIEYFASSDNPTVCNLTNHAYFNLDGQGAISAHDVYLKINADYVTEVDSELLPTGNIVPVKNTPFDFTDYKQIKRDILSDNKQIKFMNGYDCNFCLNNNGKYAPVINAYSKNSGVTLKVYTDRPGVQLYTGWFLTDRKGKCGKTYVKNTSFCLETQSFPDAVNNQNFPSVILNKNENYYTKTTYEFNASKELL